MFQWRFFSKNPLFCAPNNFNRSICTIYWFKTGLCFHVITSFSSTLQFETNMKSKNKDVPELYYPSEVVLVSKVICKVSCEAVKSLIEVFRIWKLLSVDGFQQCLKVLMYVRNSIQLPLKLCPSPRILSPKFISHPKTALVGSSSK